MEPVRLVLAQWQPQVVQPGMLGTDGVWTEVGVGWCEGTAVGTTGLTGGCTDTGCGVRSDVWGTSGGATPGMGPEAGCALPTRKLVPEGAGGVW